MNWIELKTEDQLASLVKESFENPVLIFKHSTRCSISSMALDRLERAWKSDEVEGLNAYYLDLLEHRPISNQIASAFQVDHESPQILIFSQGNCIYNNSHMGISYHEVKRVFESVVMVN